MTRRRRSPEPQDPRKRFAFNIPASLQHLSAISRNLAHEADVQNGVDKENDNSRLVARAQAQALSVSPPRERPSQPANPPSIRWHEGQQKDFPEQQTWVQPGSGTTTQGHAKYLQKHWQETQLRERAAQAAINAQRRQASEQAAAKRRTESEARAVQDATHQAEIRRAAEQARIRWMTRVQEYKFDDQPQVEFPESQQWPKKDIYAPMKFDEEIEKRRQAIIDKLKEKNPASIAAASHNMQVSTGSTPASYSPAERQRSIAHTIQSTSQPRGKQGPNAPRPGNTPEHQSKIAALVAQKRAENAANGRLNGWLNARDTHRHLQDAASRGVNGIAQGPLGPSVGHMVLTTHPEQRRPVPTVGPSRPVSHPSSAAPSKSTGKQPEQQQQIGTVVELESAASTSRQGTEDIDLKSLFSSTAQGKSDSATPNTETQQNQPAPSQSRPKPTTRDSGPTQLPSPAISPASESEAHGAASPSLQLLNEVASSSNVSASYKPEHVPAPSHAGTWPTDVGLSGPPRQSMSQTQMRPNIVDQHSSSSQSGAQQAMQRSQNYTSASNVVDDDDEVHQRAQQPSQYEQAQKLLEQLKHEHDTKQWNRGQVSNADWQNATSMAPMAAMQPPTAGYYKIKQHLWNSYDTGQFAATPPSYTRTTSSPMLASSISTTPAVPYSSSRPGRIYLQDSEGRVEGVYQRERGPYQEWAPTHQSRVSANFRSATQQSFQVPKR